MQGTTDEFSDRECVSIGIDQAEGDDFAAELGGV